MWTFTLPDGPVVSPADLTSGEVGLLYEAVNDGGVTHTEDEISPNHCPLCRNAIALVATLRIRLGDNADKGLTIEAAAGLVRSTMPHELKAMIGSTDLPTPSAGTGGPNRATRRMQPRPAKPAAAVKKPAKKRAG